MSITTEAAKSVSLPIVQKAQAFHFTGIEWADLSMNLLRAITTRDCWALKGDVVPEGTEGAKLIKAGTTGWFCVHVSEGCRNCYSETMNIRFGCGLNYKAQYLKSGLVKVVLDEKRLEAMLKWKIPKGFKSKVDGSDRPKCFPFDMTDVAGDWVTFEMLDRIFAAMALRPDIDFMLLTKRIERMAEWFGVAGNQIGSRRTLIMRQAWFLNNEAGGAVGRHMAAERAPWPLDNVLIGCSAENQKTYNERVQCLLKCPARRRFMSLEPLLEELCIDRVAFADGTGSINPLTGNIRFPCKGVNGHPDFVAETNDPKLKLPRVHLMIAGCESGSSRRHIHDDAYGSILAQCEVAGVAYFQKQMEVDGKVTGDVNTFPRQLRVRQFPKLQPLTKE